MEKQAKQKKEAPKGCVVIMAIIIIALPIWLVSKCVGGSEQKDYSKEWAAMIYEQRQQFLENKIAKFKFNNASNLESQLRNKIKEMALDASSIKYTLDPSIYNGTARITEADSAWIFIDVKFSAKNAYGVNMPYAGYITYKYIPETDMLSVHKWDISENKQ